MTKQRITFLLLFILLHKGMTWAQSSRSAYHLDGYVFCHELNPAFQPETNYYSIPLIGNSSISVQATMKLSDFFYTSSDGGQTTFMNRGTISKPELMEKVGDAYKMVSDAKLTLFSIGKRIDANRYQTLSVSMRAMKYQRVGKGFFDLLKDVENRSYDLSDFRLETTGFVEIAAGESRKIDEHWTIGAKAKLLVGLAYLNAEVDQMNINLNEDRWHAQGLVSVNGAGISFETVTKEYMEVGRGTYEMVSDFDVNYWCPRGLGLAADIGARYQYDEHWNFSVSVRDLGFITWFSTQNAQNNGEAFEFDGIHDVCYNTPDYEYIALNPNRIPLSSKLDELKDDFMNMAHLEVGGSHVMTNMISATIHGGVQYRNKAWTAGALFSSWIQGNMTSFEGRAQLSYRFRDNLDCTISPAYSNYGFSLGGMITYRPTKKHYLFLGSDAITTSFNKQLIPVSLCGSIQLGMAITY